MNIQFIKNPTKDLDIQANPDETKTVVVFFNEKSGEKHINISMRPLENSKLYVVVACMIKGDSQLTLETHQIHDKEYGWSDFLCKSVLRDTSRFSYRGHIRIGTTGQHAHAYQRNENLVLSDETRVVSEPNLEILANDVFCTHGATTGYLNDVEMHYLESRGLSHARAESLYTEGFLISIVDKLVQAGASAEMVESVRSKLETQLS